METTGERLTESAASVRREALEEMKKPVYVINPEYDMVSDDDYDKILSDEDDADFDDCGLPEDPNDWIKSGEDVEKFLDDLLRDNAFTGNTPSVNKVKAKDARNPLSETQQDGTGNTTDVSRNPRSGEEDVTLSRTISITINAKTTRKNDGTILEDRTTTITTCKNTDASRVNVTGILNEIVKDLKNPGNVRVIRN